MYLGVVGHPEAEWRERFREHFWMGSTDQVYDMTFTCISPDVLALRLLQVAMENES